MSAPMSVQPSCQPSMPPAEAEPEPDNRWVRCESCAALLYRKRFVRCLRVCPECGRHHRLTAGQRTDQLLDLGSAAALEPIGRTVTDPLGFVDQLPYPERLSAARARTGLDEAVLCTVGTIGGHPVVLAVMDFRFMGGSLGVEAGERVTQAAERALSDRIPLILVTASGGIRMQEGPLALMQMPKTCQALAQLDEEGVLTVSVLTDPTYGGVSASFATLTDVILAEPKARIGFAGRRVIEQTVCQQLPEDFQTAEFFLRHGLLDHVVPRSQLRAALLRLLAVQGPLPEPYAEHTGTPPTYPAPAHPAPKRDAWQAVTLARHAGRPTTLDYIGYLLEGFQELHGDRICGDCPAIVAGVGKLDGLPLVVVGHQKGHTTGELIERNFGMSSPQGYRKAARLMRLAAKWRIPVLTLIDTPGAAAGLEADRHGQAVAIAESQRLMASLPVPIVAVVTGEGGSGGAVALGVADKIFACANAVYSVISPEGCAAILWGTPSAAPMAAASLGLDADRLLDLGVIDAVIPEPPGGADRNHVMAAARLRTAVIAAFAELLRRERDQLAQARRGRFRAFGLPHAARQDRFARADSRGTRKRDS
ncbi:MAG: acetyl-CoA carboxylase, carboxyltransferase subunit beta [Pseudonocardiaceae bacterium]